MIIRRLIVLFAFALLCGNGIQCQIPQDAVRANERGVRRLKQSDLDAAINEFTRAILITSGLTPKSISGMQPQLSVNGFDVHDALVGITVIDPFIAQLYASRALARFRKRDFTGAIADLDRAIYINPRLASAFNNRAAAHYSLGNKEAALSDWTRTIVLDPQSVSAYTNRGGLKLELGDRSGALEDLNKAMTLNARAAMPYVHRGYLWIAAYQNHLKGDDLTSVDFPNAESFVDRGLADFNRAIVLDSTLADAYSGRAVIETSQNNFDKAFSDFTYSLKLKPDQPNVYMNRGLALMMLGKTQEAERDFARCLSLAPNKSEELKLRKKLAKELMQRP